MSDPRRELLPLHEAQHSFDVVLRGYDRSQVADTLGCANGGAAARRTDPRRADDPGEFL